MTAISEDGIVEAIEDPDCKFYLSVQWHPEAMDEYDINQGNIIKEFIDSCRN
jgi:putative glutamine amidotransferase